MKYNSDQLINGAMNYANSEVMNKLPTLGKWILGAGMGMISDKAGAVVSGLKDNSVLKALEVVDNDGLFDIDTIAKYLREAANKYGKAYVEIPMIGSIALTADDVEMLRSYIERS